nr:RecName: Full=Chi-conotoxin-like 2; AltName: Full=Tx10c [Conus textile]
QTCCGYRMCVPC